MRMYQVDAFTDEMFGGNPAAVLVHDRGLGDGLMQAIAAENNLSETAFVLRESSGLSIRWFTPTREARFCGHGTLASGHVLMTEYDMQGEITLRSRVGELKVGRHGLRYRLDLPGFAPAPLDPAPEWVHDLFGEKAVHAFQNFQNFFVELRSEADVRSYQPDLSRILELYPRGLCITARGEKADFVSRYFAPGAGIPEDPVTGSTHATLAPYWSARLGSTEFEAEQCSQRVGRLRAVVDGDRVALFGNAVTFMSAALRLPPLIRDLQSSRTAEGVPVGHWEEPGTAEAQVARQETGNV